MLNPFLQFYKFYLQPSKFSLICFFPDFITNVLIIGLRVSCVKSKQIHICNIFMFSTEVCMDFIFHQSLSLEKSLPIL